MIMRRRDSGQTAPKGTGVWSFGGPISIGGDYPIVTASGSVDDSYCAPDNGPFHVTKRSFTGGRINGRQPDSTQWTNYIADALEGFQSWDHARPNGSPDAIAAATMGAKRTNPSRPYIDLPSEMLQLHDVVDALRGTGFQTLSKKGASVLIATYFGVNPLLDDIRKLLKLQGQISKRVQELQKLHKAGGLRRTVEVFRGSNTLVWDSVMQSNLGWYTAAARYACSEIVRVHCRWLPSATFFPWETTPPASVETAWNALQGNTIDMGTVWELIPWTWLIDWFGNVSDYLAASRNTVAASLSSVTVMRHISSEWNFNTDPAYPQGTAYLSPALVKVEDKDRVLSAVFPEASLPFLDERQIATGGALTILKSSPF